MRNSSQKMAGKIDVISKHILDQKIDVKILCEKISGKN